MYNNDSIQALYDRIGWADALEPTDIEVSEENKESTSGRFFNSFNPLVIVENIFATLPNKDATNDTLNAELLRLKKDGVSDVLMKVFNTNIRATAAVTNYATSVNYASDYSGVIIASQQSFDDVIGLSVAIKSLELIMTTVRSNQKANNPNIDRDILSYLHGSFTNERVITPGLYAQYREAIDDLINVLFPLSYPEGAIIDGDKVIIKPRPILRGVKPW